MKNIEFGKRLKESRIAAGLTQAQVVKKINIKQGSLSELENGKTSASTFTIALAKLYGVDAEWLATGKGDKKIKDFDKNVSAAPIGDRRIPLLNYIQAGNFTEHGQSFCPEDSSEYLPTHLDLSPRAFALEIRGDSMLPLFEPGDLVVIDCEICPLPGDYVVARNGKHEATFKRYKLVSIAENEVFELVPLNENYPSMRSDQMQIEIIGVMVEHRKFRRKR